MGTERRGAGPDDTRGRRRRVNYYERHLGDWMRDTSGISMLEEGAYNRLVDAYYSQEEGIEHERRYLVARAMSGPERKAVDAVLTRFFRKEGDRWVKGRVQEELNKARARIDAAKENGKRGGRPAKNPEVTKQKPSGFPLGSDQLTQDLTQKKAHHLSTYPDITTNSSGDGSSEVGANDATDRQISPGSAACIAMREAGIPVHLLNPQHAELLAALDAGATPAEFGATAAELISSGKPAHMTYVIRAVTGRRDAASRLRATNGKPSVTDTFAERTYTGTSDDDLPEHLRPAA